MAGDPTGPTPAGPSEQRPGVTRRPSNCWIRRLAYRLDLEGGSTDRGRGEGAADDALAVAGPAVRVAVGGVRGELVRHLLRVRRVPADRDRRAARGPGRGVGAGGGGPGGRGGGRDTTRPLDGVPGQ